MHNIVDFLKTHTVPKRMKLGVQNRMSGPFFGKETERLNLLWQNFTARRSVRSIIGFTADWIVWHCPLGKGPST